MGQPTFHILDRLARGVSRPGQERLGHGQLILGPSWSAGSAGNPAGNIGAEFQVEIDEDESAAAMLL